MQIKCIINFILSCTVCSLLVTCNIPIQNRIYFKKISNTNNLKILILGNSITGAPSQITNWQDCWGVAASAPEKDFVHLLKGNFVDALKYEPRLVAYNLSGFERNFPTFDLNSLDSLKKYNADLIILRFGDNVLKDMAIKGHFWEKFEELANFINQNENQVIFCTSSYYPNRNVDAIMKAVCEKKEISFIDITSIYYDKSNRASSERNIENSGIGSHPGDKGMRMIADILWENIKVML